MGSPSFLGEVTACTSPRNLVALCHLGVIAGAQICDHSCAQVEELLCRFGAQECAEGEEAKIPNIGQAQPCPVPLCHQSGPTEPPRARSIHLEGQTPHSSPIPPAFPQPRLIPKTLIGTGGTFGLPPAELLPSNLAGRHRLELCITPLTPPALARGLKPINHPEALTPTGTSRCLPNPLSLSSSGAEGYQKQAQCPPVICLSPKPLATASPLHPSGSGRI